MFTPFISLIVLLSRLHYVFQKAREPVCTITLKVHKRAGSHKSGLLHQRGIASTSVPMRLDTGDIVLFDNSHIMAYGTKFFTMSQVLLSLAIITSTRIVAYLHYSAM